MYSRDLAQPLWLDLCGPPTVGSPSPTPIPNQTRKAAGLRIESNPQHEPCNDAFELLTLQNTRRLENVLLTSRNALSS